MVCVYEHLNYVFIYRLALEQKVYQLERQLAASLNAQKTLEDTCRSHEKEMQEMEKTFNIMKQRYTSQKSVAKQVCKSICALYSLIDGRQIDQ